MTPRCVNPDAFVAAFHREEGVKRLARRTRKSEAASPPAGMDCHGAPFGCMHLAMTEYVGGVRYDPQIINIIVFFRHREERNPVRVSDSETRGAMGAAVDNEV